MNIEQAIQYNAMQYKAQSPTELICSAIIYAIESEYAKVVPMGTPLVKDKDKYTILDGGNFFHLKQMDLPKIVENFCRNAGLNTAKRAKTTLASTLTSAGIAKRFMEGSRKRNGTKLPGYGTRYMEINKQKLYENAGYEPGE